MARATASHAGGGAAPAAPPSPPRDGAPAPRETVRKVLHLFSGPANKKEGLKAMVVERATRSEALRGVKVAVQEVDLLDEAGKKARPNPTSKPKP